MDKKKILLVDDVNLFLQLGKTMLQRNDIEVETAGSGNEALEKANSTKPDIIFLDLYMPDLNGDEVCRKLKADPATNSIPVVMLTSEGDGDARGFCLAAGCDDFITKPIQPEALQTALERHLKERPRHHRRADVNLPCAVEQAGEKDEGVLLSLSPYGAFVEMSPPPLPGQTCTLSFVLPGNSEPVILIALPRWSRKKSEESPIGSGFEFKDVDEGVFARINSFVNELLS